MNEETKTLYDKLKSEIGVSEWDLLEVHQKRGAVVFIDDNLDLAAVGASIADDKVQDIKKWLESNSIHPPSKEQLIDWRSRSGPFLEYLIVSPYVLVKKK